MMLADFKAALSLHPESGILFVFDDDETIPANFHVTEVGHVVKRFVDCGGTKRTSEACVLQAWVAANDADHRLTAGKLAKIIELGSSLLPSDALEVEIEYEQCVLSQYRINGYGHRDGQLHFALEDKHTDCLAKEACGLDACGCGPGAPATVGAKCC